ncbi:MAG: Ig-like domain-containing protein [Pseudomonadota bacterium]
MTFLYKTPTNFRPVHFTQGPDGYVYYADLVRGQIEYIEITDPLAPIAEDDIVETDPGDSFCFNVLENDTDPDGDELTASLVSGPENGVIQFDLDGGLSSSRLVPASPARIQSSIWRMTEMSSRTKPPTITVEPEVFFSR